MPGQLLAADPWAWTGGWLHACAGVTYDLDPTAGPGDRTGAVTVQRAGSSGPEPLDPGATSTVAGYYYERASGKVGPLETQGEVRVLTADDEGVLDVTEAVVRHLTGGPVTAATSGIRLAGPLPAPLHGNPEIQPLRGAGPRP